MNDNEVWDLVELPKESKRIECKWVFKTKRDSNGNIEQYKARLVTKGYIQKDDIGYKETFSPVSKKNSLRIIMALVAHYDLELHQMDVKTAFLNGNLDEEVFMDQPEGFMVEGKEHMMETIPYASIVGSLLYAQTCTRPDIGFAVGMLGVRGIIVQGVAESQCDISTFSYASLPRPKFSICTIGERGGRLRHTASLSADSDYRTADLLIELSKYRTIVLRSYDCDKWYQSQVG
ncbi:Retrovirus-related Pol polyprotein from transposon TNT 1-94 [Cucumis melo var. makuwa]|uniref:Retrovirus-related Pol polyprotein from transposon TNT 1-94 n=1 Tax=Cucumis melo var. makuwa TaxID=1194695 RepID=A0A5A7SR28_CUCMM|nr:Retrovirus-related Pol polyprotein from transposon TNT 1-94 [Cucumis melo var. makuwa]TYJ96654.1 Retrovirus-related Pol polyprotein from transposon TNT 1-94 [Cucumis melo var. makuwa]